MSSLYFKKMYDYYYSFSKYEIVFVVLSFFVNSFFLLYFFGFLKDKNIWIENISFYLKMFIGIFLVARFNPFYSFTRSGNNFTRFDKTVVFSAGIYIFIINSIVFYNHLKHGSTAEPAKAEEIQTTLLLKPQNKKEDCGCGCGGASKSK